MSAKQRRQGFRVSATREVKAVRTLLANPTPGVGKSLQRKSTLLESYLQKLETCDNEVLALLENDTQVESELVKIREFNDAIMEAIADAKPLARSLSGNAPLNASFSSATNGSGPAKVKLPKLEIPPFEGDPIRWQEFWDAFKSAIHDRTDLALIDKFNYLRGLLKGEAFCLIEGFRLTSANYEEAVKTLDDRYGDKQAVIFAHIDALLSLPPATGDVASLQSMCDQLERHLRSLDSLQPGPDMILYSVIMSKLPRFLKVEAHRKKGSRKDWSLSDLREWLHEELRARDMGERLHHLNVSDRKEMKNSPKATGPVHPPRFGVAKKGGTSTSVLISHSKEDMQCPFCNAGHAAEKCSQFVNCDARRAQLHDRCFICLGSGHMSKSCRKKKTCHFCRKSNHHASLCFQKFGRNGTTATSVSGFQASSGKVPRMSGQGWVSTSSAPAVAQNVLSSTPSTASPWAPTSVPPGVSSVIVAPDVKSERAVMQTALAPVMNVSTGFAVVSRLFFDTGASRSFITEKKQLELGLQVIDTERFSVAGFQSPHRTPIECNLVQFGVRCRDGSIQMVEASVVPIVTCPILRVPLGPPGAVIPTWALAEPLVDQPEFAEVDILIGLDHYYSFVSTQLVQCGPRLHFLSSRLGFVATGHVPTDGSSPDTVAVMLLDSQIGCTSMGSPITDLARYWDLEEIGMQESLDKGTLDEEALQSFSSTVKFEMGRYQVQWPWKTPICKLPNNFGVAYGRLKSLLKRLADTPEMLDAYDANFRQQFELGIIEEVPKVPTGESVYYMPHHGVFNPHKPTTKLRIVFDASSKAGKDAVSLNECLYRGPIFLADLCGLLLRFRTHPIALVSDIEKAFLQVGLQPSQRDATRFLWVRNIHDVPMEDNVVAFRFCRVPFGVISSPFLLAATVAHHLKQTISEVADKILCNLYVDNVITGEASLSEAVCNYEKAKDIFKSASMNLREWYSNSSEVLEHIPPDDHGKEDQPKVLGLRWNTQSDTLRSCAVRETGISSPVTKRSILKTLPQVFDPCGFLSPVVVAGKMLVQDLWKLGLGWDEVVPEDILNTWQEFVLPNLKQVSQIEIGRYIGDVHTTRLQLHVFCDASIRVCSASVYLRMEGETGEVTSNLLMAKTRLAPLKQQLTIPRLELVAAVLGSRLLQFVAKQIGLSVEGKYLWTDSKCVLYWLRKDQVTTRFVENRLAELRKLVDWQFRHVPTAENPADLSTRKCDVTTLQNSSLWWRGPPWLSKSIQRWPASLGDADPPFNEETQSDLVQIVMPSTAPSMKEKLLNETKFSSLGRLLRVTAYVQRFCKNVRKSPEQRMTGPLQSAELAESMRLWVLQIQQDNYPAVLKQPGQQKNMVRDLGVFQDYDGVLRCKGRIGLADVPYETKYPALLPKTGHFTQLVIEDNHGRVMHSGVAQTLASVRQRFWIVQGRSAVKRVLHNCRLCRRVEGGPFRCPPAPPLPKFRVGERPPFSCTGIDYLGPLLAKHDGQKKKVWICLFTCASVRAIHLEVVEGLTVDQFLLALRRFIALHGPPAMLVSDNAKQFHASHRILNKLWGEIRASELVHNFMGTQGMDWKFIPELAPWMGGFYERLVGVVKRALKKTLFGICASTIELQTVVAEIVSVVNSRPLLYIENEVGSVPLSPMQLLSPMRREGGLIVPGSQADPDYQDSSCALLIRWRRLQAAVTNFWKSWKSQYLLSLRDRKVRHQQHGALLWAPAVGTVVHLKENLPRASWRLGIITSLYPSQDGHVRSVSVRVANGNQLRRPLKLLYPLEMEANDTSLRDSVENSDDVFPVGRPKRSAACSARQKWQAALDTYEDAE